jgi:hypothetical protein
MVAATPVRLEEPCGRLLRSEFIVWRSASGVYHIARPDLSDHISPMSLISPIHRRRARLAERQRPNIERRTPNAT